MWSIASYGAEIIRHFREQIRMTREVIKYVSGEGWRKSVGPIM